ncbi:MAG: hypothetical protein KAG66_17470, partial [Methylococcales bacterium]|nr:hypothetical protein [Methylococcales bacterium]
MHHVFSWLDFDYLNRALNNKIAAFSLGTFQACAIGQDGGVACINAEDGLGVGNHELEDIPEPDAQYIELSKLDRNNSGICGIQQDNRTVCWGQHAELNAVPPEALYLKQIDVYGDVACGVDLTDNLVCWGGARIYGDGHGGQQYRGQFGRIEPSTITQIKQVAITNHSACVLTLDNTLECFNTAEENTNVFAGRQLESM